MGIDEYRRAGGENVAKATSTPDESSVSPYRNEENSLDMLKNTPSNIARLADEIEQCEGRQKYLAQTRSPSDGGDVRWYFCKVPLGMNGESSGEPSSLPSFEELAASVPRTEIVGKGEYFRFGMRDSLAIEASFLQREEELLSYWWKEYAECSEGPKGQCGSSPKVDFDTSFQNSELYAVEEERVGVPVKGGLYEVDLLKRHSFPVYWNGDYRRVLRGQWFALSGGLDWLPLREDVAEQLEFAYRRQVWHRRTFQPSGLFAARINLQGPTSGLHALFTGEDDTWEAWLNVDASGFSNVISLGGNGIKLRRGYSKSQSPKPTQDELRQQKEEQMDDYCSQVPVQHLVFMVHGIGQRLEKSNLVDDVGNFRHITSALAEKHLTSYQRSTKRVLFIPCQWRKGLKLSSESAVEKITLDGVRGLRTALSATVHDVLYYMSPIYCQDIIDSVSNQLNLLYLKFLKRNPGYEGKVSIYGHSLGSVLSYDILCHQGTLSSSFPMDCMYPKEEEKNKSPNYLSKPSPECNSRTGGAGNMSHDIHDVNLSRHLPSATLANELGEDSHSTVGLDPCILSIRERMPSMDVKNDVNANSASSVDDLGAVSEPSDAFHQGNDVIWTMNSGNTETEPNMLISNLNAGLDDESGNIAAGTSNAAVDKDTEVLALRAQINTLKMRVAELESHFGGDMTSTMCQASQDVHAAVTNKDDNQKVPPGHNDSPKSYKPYIKYTKLGFKVDTFFAVGSPLGVFLALRNVRLGIGKGKEYWEEGNIIEEMPACKRMFNIFHPFDPVAYRVEPLICKEYVSRRPVIVPYHRGGKRLHIGLQDFAEDMAARSQAIVDHLNFLRAKVLTVCESRNKESLEEGVDGKENTEERSYGSMMMEHLSGSAEGRIDYVLQDKTFQHPYISALGSHTNYWRDYDTALFILKHLYCDVPDDSGHQEGLYSGGLKGDSRSAVSSGTGEYAEELPLTFSDSALVKSFSKSSKLL